MLVAVDHSLADYQVSDTAKPGSADAIGHAADGIEVYMITGDIGTHHRHR